jgi:hypothetical protein
VPPEQEPVAGDRFGDGTLVPFVDSLWTAATPVRFAGTWFSHVMTVVRLRNGSALLHSPCRPSGALLDAVAEIGSVAHVVAPNWFHDLYLREYRASYPNAAFWGPRLLQRQHPALIDNVLDADLKAPWADELPYIPLSGLLSFDEAVFFHVASGTLIVADLLTNASTDGNAPPFTRLGYRLVGLDGRLKVFPPLRWLGFTSRASLRRAVSQIAAWNPDRLIVGHGYPI